MFKVPPLVEKITKALFALVAVFGFYVVYLVINVYLLAPGTITQGKPHTELGEEEHHRVGLSSLSIFSFVEQLGIVESHLSYYNAGTGFLLSGYYSDSANLLEISLSKVEKINHECFIRNNLALAYEKMGDTVADDGTALALTYYEKAVTVIQEAPPACFPPPPPTGGEGEEDDNESESSDAEQEELRENGENMSQTEERSQSKADQIEVDDKSQANKDELQNNMNETNADNQNGRDLDSQEGDNDGTPNNDKRVDKPW